MSKRPVSAAVLLAKDNAARRKKHLARMKAEATRLANSDKTWPARRQELEAELLRAKPHLAKQAHCGYAPDAPDAPDRPRRKVRCPNGVLLYTSWYKPPTTDDDARTALREANWLTEQAWLRAKGLPNSYPF